MPENPTPTPGEFQRDVGTGEQLGYGEATQLNDQLAQGDAVEEQIAAQSIPIPVSQPQGGAPEQPIEYADDVPEYVPGAGEFDDVLFADSQQPTKQKATPNTPLPNSVIRMLPKMAAIVNDPNTPDAIRAAYQMTMQRLEAELRRKYR